MADSIQAVFFDAGYTLLCMDPDQPTLFARTCAALGIAIDPQRLPAAVERANVLLGPRQPADVPAPFSQAAVDAFWTRYNRELLSVCAVRASDAERAEEVYRLFAASIRWRVYDDVPSVLATLRRRGLRTGVISNWTGELEDVLAQTGLLAYFDFALDSARLGHEKPHAPIFEEALRRSGVPAHAALHVGDSVPHDVEGALQWGLRAVLLDRANRHPAYERAPRIAHLGELLGLLGHSGERVEAPSRPLR
jgi:HAD superfamily hydrolase (TIGR01509 family)